MKKIISFIIATIMMIMCMFCVTGCAKNENIELEKTDKSYESMIVDIESKDGGFYSTYADLTLHYYDGDLSYVTVSSPTLLSFKVPDKYEDGVVVFSGTELNKLIEYVNNGDTESALKILNELYAIEDCPT